MIFFKKVRKLSKYDPFHEKKLFGRLHRVFNGRSYLSKAVNVCFNSSCRLFYIVKFFKPLRRLENNNSLEYRYSKPYSVDRTVSAFSDFKSKIDSISVVSFDVFDTLIIRPFQRPVDLFHYIEITENCPGFADERIKAEKRARNLSEGREDISIKDVYYHIKPKFQHLLEKEISTEYKFLKKNPLISSYLDLVKEKNIRVIAISDMYLPGEIIRNILRKNNIELDAVYVSSDLGKTKGTGNLFKYVLEKEGLASHALVHVGDNIFADHRKPSELGIQTSPLFTYHSEAEDKIPYFRSLLSTNLSLGCSIWISLVSLMQLREVKKNYWWKLGYMLGGPLVLSYVNFVASEASKNKIDMLFFAARDGYVLHKVYQRFFFEKFRIRSEYVYLSRAIGIRALLEYSGSPKYLKLLLRSLSKEIPSIQVSENFEKNQEQYRSLLSQMEAATEKERNIFKKYLRSKAGQCNNIMVVDTTTGNFSSLNFAAKVLGEKVKMGAFTASFYKNEALIYEVFYEPLIQQAQLPCVKLAEVLVSSPEAPIVGLNSDLSPVFSNTEREKAKIYRDIEEGILKFCEDYYGKFEINRGCLMNMKEWFSLANLFLLEAGEEYQNKLSSITFTDISEEGKMIEEKPFMG